MDREKSRGIGRVKNPTTAEKERDYSQNKIGSLALWENDKNHWEQLDFTGTVSFCDGNKKFKITLLENKGSGKRRNLKTLSRTSQDEDLNVIGEMSGEGAFGLGLFLKGDK